MELAAVGIKVEGIQGADKAADSLEKLADAGDSAKVSLTGAGAASKSAKPSIDALGAASAKAAQEQARLEAMARQSGMSVNAMKAALRGVPAQFTDIAISLQGGMNPLTVFLQQGGQLKDMFGGAVPAARALGGYVLGLVNPLTLAAAAIAALGVAYYQGSSEADRFRVALVTTGNAAGHTVGEMTQMARAISEVTGTQGAATDALAAMVSAGVKAEGQLKQYTETAIRWSKATGQGVDVVAERFVALQKDPVSAALKLNESTNFLTTSLYEQIKALDEQGKSAEASALVMDAFARYMREGAENIEKNLGSLERGWNAVAGAAKGAWDWMLNIGRQATLMEKLAAEQEKLRKLETEIVGLYERGTYQKRLATQREIVTGLLDEVAAEELNAAAKKEAAQQLEEKVQKDKELEKFNTKYRGALESQITLEQHLNKVREDALKVGKSEVEIQKLLAYETEQYNKKNQQSASAGGGGISELANIQARVHATQQLIKALQEQGAAAEQITEGERLAYKIQQEIDSGRLNTAQRMQKMRELEAAQMLQAAEEEVRAERMRIALVEKAKAAEADRINTLMDSEARLQALRDKNAVALASYGMGDRAASEFQARMQMEQEQLRQVADMRRQHGEELRKAESDAERAFLEAMFQERLRITQEGFAAELLEYDAATAAKKAKELDWLAGAKSALATYAEQSADVYSQTKGFATNTLNSISGAFTNMVMTGKLEIRSLALSVIQELVRMAIQAAITRAAMSFFGGFAEGGVVGGVGFSSGGYTGSGGKYQPAGIVHKGEVVFSQEDVARHGGAQAVDQFRKTGYLERAASASNASPVAAPQGGVTVQVIEDASRAGRTEESTGDNSERVIQIFVSNIRQGGEAAEALQSTFGLARQGV